MLKPQVFFLFFGGRCRQWLCDHRWLLCISGNRNKNDFELPQIQSEVYMTTRFFRTEDYWSLKTPPDWRYVESFVFFSTATVCFKSRCRWKQLSHGILEDASRAVKTTDFAHHLGFRGGFFYFFLRSLATEFWSTAVRGSAAEQWGR